jgi:RND family efflux transporter MFP subunit
MIASRLASLAGLTLLAGCGSSQPDEAATPTPTTLVTTVAPREGSLAQTIETYGTASPSANGLVTLSVPQPGQVTAVAAVAGARVRAGQPVVTFQVAPSARSTYLQAVNALRAAEQSRATTAQILTQQLATRDQLVQADKAVADARIALAALRQEGAGAGSTTMRAPFAGIVTAIPVAPGERTQPGQALATIARAGAVIVTVGVDPARRGEVRAGAPVRLTRLDPGGASVTGHVVRMDATLNDKTHQIDVDIGYPAGAVLPGEAMRAAIETGRASGWLVPHRAVVIDANGKAQVFQVIGGKARAVAVRVAISGRDQDLLTGPIDARAPLVVDGAFQLGDGDAVRTGPAR